MNAKIRAFWRWLTTTRPDTQHGTARRGRFHIWRHTAWLEAEVERLREECAETRRQNWALVNSLVTTAGAPLPQEVLRQAQNASAASGDAASRASASAKRTSGRRSWHQVARALEIESARPQHSATRTGTERPER